jgi:predicted methyltransferase
MLRKSSLNWLVVCTLAICPLLIYGRASAQDESLKPGINDGYEKQPVESSVKRFENDKRAVVMKQAEILKACRLEPGMIVADVGSGTGLFTRPIAAGVAPGGKVYAVDVTEQFVQHVKATCREEGLKNVVGVVCKPTSTELPAGVIDLVFTSDTYHHFEFPYKMLASIHQSLRDEGILIIVDRKEASDHVRAGQDTVKQEAASAGFEFLDAVDLAEDQYLMRFKKVQSAPKGPL